MWGGGEYEQIAALFAGIHEGLVDRLEPRPGERWLDVGTGTGGVALRAARAGADVTGLDLSEGMLEKAARVAADEGLSIRLDLGDAEALPYEDSSFDVVSSCFAVIFAPNPVTTAGELARVCRPGGRLGLTSWRENEALDALYASYAPEPSVDATAWEDVAAVTGLLGSDFELELAEGVWELTGGSGEELWELWTTAVPPFRALLGTLEPGRGEAFREDFVRFYEQRRDGDVVRENRPFLWIFGTRR